MSMSAINKLKVEYGTLNLGDRNLSVIEKIITTDIVNKKTGEKSLRSGQNNATLEQ